MYHCILYHCILYNVSVSQLAMLPVYFLFMLMFFLGNETLSWHKTSTAGEAGHYQQPQSNIKSAQSGTQTKLKHFHLNTGDKTTTVSKSAQRGEIFVTNFLAVIISSYTSLELHTVHLTVFTLHLLIYMCKVGCLV